MHQNAGESGEGGKHAPRQCRSGKIVSTELGAEVLQICSVYSSEVRSVKDFVCSVRILAERNSLHPFPHSLL